LQSGNFALLLAPYDVELVVKFVLRMSDNSEMRLGRAEAAGRV
jgi:hypothetical protein